MTKLTSCILFVLIVACNENKTDHKAEGEKLMEISREWSRAASTDSVDKIMSYWADSAVFFSNGQPMLNGKAEIRGMVESSSQIPGFNISWEPISVSISESGDMAYMIEQNKVTVNDSVGNPVTTYGKGVTIWKKDGDGNWKNVVEISVNDPVSKQ